MESRNESESDGREVGILVSPGIFRVRDSLRVCMFKARGICRDNARIYAMDVGTLEYFLCYLSFVLKSSVILQTTPLGRLNYELPLFLKMFTNYPRTRVKIITNYTYQLPLGTDRDIK